MEVQRGSEAGRKTYALDRPHNCRDEEIDPTRPIFIHNGGPGGDIYTVNHYLNFIPLQEREEWLIEYVTKGDMPLWYVEFGTPLYSSFMRGRNGYGNTTASEPFVSEYSAIYFGADAYRNQSEAYLREMASQFVKDQQYRGWHANRILTSSPNFLMMQELFIRNTWRSWRTMGITGGMVPWDDGYTEINGKTTPAGMAMRENNAPTLAWIAGAASTTDKTAFTDKDHNFMPGQTVRKQIALINDSRETQPYSLTWQATVDGKRVGGARASGRIAVAQNIFVPLSFALPTTIASNKSTV
jgi:beta-galactosidase